MKESRIVRNWQIIKRKWPAIGWPVTVAALLILSLMLMTVFLLSIEENLFGIKWMKNLSVAILINLSATSVAWLFALLYRKDESDKICKFSPYQFEFKGKEKIENSEEIDSVLDLCLYDRNNVLEYIVFNDSRDNKKHFYARPRPDFEIRYKKEFGNDRLSSEQKEAYKELAEYIHDTVDKLNDKKGRFTALKQDVLFRVVYDVKKGGVFYYHICDNVYLFGATIEQREMDNNMADAQFRIMVKHVERCLDVSL